MKIILYSDLHYCSYSSILRSREGKYSVRLNNMLQTLNWIESLAWEYGCEMIICAGDFFDKSELNSEELTALQDVKWAPIQHKYLVGNHEMGRSSLELSSSHVFNISPNSEVIDTPRTIVDGDREICFLPYILEHDRKPIDSYFPKNNSDRIIISHNDLKGIQVGRFVSNEGFSIEDIHDNCNLFLNGHLHNGSWVSEKVLNLGNITGQNFGEDAIHFKHQALILDTVEHSMTWVENPHALKFYKIDVSSCSAGEKGKIEIKQKIGTLGNNAVVTVKSSREQSEFVKHCIEENVNILASRVVFDVDTNTSTSTLSSEEVSFSVDHLKKFSDYVAEVMPASDVVQDELLKLIG